MNAFGAALVLGGAQSVWDDIAALEAVVGRWRGPVLAINNIACERDLRTGQAWERRIDHLCTLHAEKVALWRRKRRELVISLGRSPEWDVYETWSCGRRTAVDRHYSGITGGSSGLYAVSVALHLGFERVVLAGVPMTNERNAFRDEAQWKAFRRYTDAWVDRSRNALPLLAGRVRSMSGWTREILGPPELDWIRAHPQEAA